MSLQHLSILTLFCINALNATFSFINGNNSIGVCYELNDTVLIDSCDKETTLNIYCDNYSVSTMYHTASWTNAQIGMDKTAVFNDNHAANTPSWSDNEYTDHNITATIFQTTDFMDYTHYNDSLIENMDGFEDGNKYHVIYSQKAFIKQQHDILDHILLAVIICAVGIHFYFLHQTTSTPFTYFMFLSVYGFFGARSFSPAPFTFLNGSSIPSQLSTRRVCGAYYEPTNSIYFFGGSDQTKKVTRYAFDENVFHTLPDSPITISCYGQSIAIIDGIIYLKKNSGNPMVTYNISSGVFNASFQNIPLMGSGRYCYANAYDRYLIVVGGDRKSFRIFDLIQNFWFFGPNSTNITNSGSCTVHNNYLYVFYVTGGNDDRYVIKINVSDIANIAEYSWITLPESLSKDSVNGGSRLALHVEENMIYFLSPQNGIIDALDTTTDIIYNNIATPINNEWYSPIIIRDNQILVFGGVIGSCCFSYSTIWQFASLQTSVPTAAPSTAPSTSPSTAPTTCIDYKQDSNDGHNEILVNIDMILDVNKYNIHDVNTLKFQTSNALHFSGSNINCTSNDCFIKCNETGSCLQTTIKISNIYNKSVTLFCDKQFSCVAASIYSHSLVSMVNISIICADQYSCLDMKIDAINITSFNLYCLEYASCLDVDVNIENHINTEKENDGIIHCIALNGCNGLTITTSSPQTQLIMIEYSENVVIDNGFGIIYDPNNILCNVDRYIRLESNESITTDYLSNLVQNEYDNQQLPCSDVIVECGNASCSLQYRYYGHTLSIPPNTGCYWLNVQEIQNIICQGECINSPTSPPTSTPTKEPTNPTIHPSDAPTSSPTVPPSSTPSIDPTNSPTFSPTAFPSFSPVQEPSIAPTSFPSDIPTSSPTVAPSQNPSISPTEVPTESPSIAPTRFPTQNMESISYIDIIFVIENLKSVYIVELEDNTLSVIPKIIEIIESKYFVEDVVPYKDFMIEIKDINGFKDLTNINLKEDENIKLNSQILCGSDVAGILLRTSKKDEFEIGVTMDLQKRVFKNNTNLLFYVENDESLKIVTDEMIMEESKSYEIIIISIIIVGVGLFGSIFVKWSNKRKNTSIDDAGWRAPLLFSLQIYDFISDINLSYDILTNPLIYNNPIILWCGILSVIFTAFPFLSNLFYAIRIKKQSVIHNNRRADEYFTANIAIFIAFTVICGGCYPSLMMVSSGIFGLNILQSGLTKYELNRLTKIKIKSTITFENGPQLIIQIVYVIQTKGAISQHPAVFLAFIGSLLSVILAVSSFFANKENRKDAEIMNYYLKFYNKTGGKLDDKEEENIIHRKGRTEELRLSISKVFGISHDNIQIGYIWILKNGLEMFIAHFLSKSELAKYNQNRDGFVSIITPKQYLKNIYKNKNIEINKVFRTHFDIERNEFIVYFNIEHDDDDGDQIEMEQMMNQSIINHHNDEIKDDDDDNQSMQNQINEMKEMMNNNNKMIQSMMQNININENESIPIIKSMQNEMNEIKQMMGNIQSIISNTNNQNQ